jgi:hypothetical protein
MSLRIKIFRDVGGSWSVHGPSPVPVSGLPSLSASIDYARQACGAAPATIELYVDGMYIVAHQERGWPKALVTPEIAAPEFCSQPRKPQVSLMRFQKLGLRPPGSP